MIGLLLLLLLLSPLFARRLINRKSNARGFAIVGCCFVVLLFCWLSVFYLILCFLGGLLVCVFFFFLFGYFLVLYCFVFADPSSTKRISLHWKTTRICYLFLVFIMCSPLLDLLIRFTSSCLISFFSVLFCAPLPIKLFVRMTYDL